MQVTKTDIMLPESKVVTKDKNSGMSDMMGKDAFLKILVAQMSHPDPFGEQQDPGAFVQQMAQMSLLEQVANLSKQFEASTQMNALNQATELIGHNVTIADGDKVVTGMVDKVVINQSKEVALMVSGKAYDVGQLLEVK